MFTRLVEYIDEARMNIKNINACHIIYLKLKVEKVHLTI